MSLSQPTKLRVVFLQSVERAGSIFFGSLLDSHPQIAMFPRVSEFWEKWGSFDKTSPRSIAVNIIEKFPYWFNGETLHPWDRFKELGPERNQSYRLDPVQFAAEFINRMQGRPINYSSVFVNAHLAYHKVVRQTFFAKSPYEEPALIFFNVHGTNMKDFCLLSEQDVEKKVLFLTREPTANMASSYQFHLRCEPSHALDPNDLFTAYRDIVTDDLECRKIAAGHDVLTVTLEALHRQSRLVLEEFCTFAGIRFEELLLQSTIMGLAWWGNGVEPIQGLNPSFALPCVSSTFSRTGKPSATAKTMMPLIAHRLAKRGLPIGADSFRTSLWNILTFNDYERAIFWRFYGYTLAEFESVFKKLAERQAKDRRSWRLWRDNIFASMSFLSALSKKEIKVVRAYMKRLHFSWRFRRDFPDEWQRTQRPADIQDLFEKVRGFYFFDGGKNLKFHAGCGPTERIYSRQELTILVQLLAADAREMMENDAEAHGRVLMKRMARYGLAQPLAHDMPASKNVETKIVTIPDVPEEPPAPKEIDKLFL